MEQEEKQELVAKIDTALAYTNELLERLGSQDDSEAVINVSTRFLKRASAVVHLGIEAGKKYYPTQVYPLSLWQEHFTALETILNEGWDVLALKKELRALNKVLLQIKKLRETPPEPVSRYLFFRKGISPMQAASQATQMLQAARETNNAQLQEKAKKAFFSALKEALQIPYEGSKVKAVNDVVGQAAKVDKGLCEELICTIDLNEALCRDSAILSALTSFEYAEIKEAVSLTRHFFKPEAKDRALQFLFDICCDKDTEMAIKIVRKVVDSRLRYSLLAQLAKITCNTDLKQAQSLCSMIADEGVREKVQALIEQRQWQDYLRRKSQRLGQRMEIKKAVIDKNLKG